MGVYLFGGLSHVSTRRIADLRSTKAFEEMVNLRKNGWDSFFFLHSLSPLFATYQRNCAILPAAYDV